MPVENHRAKIKSLILLICILLEIGIFSGNLSSTRTQIQIDVLSKNYQIALTSIFHLCLKKVVKMDFDTLGPFGEGGLFLDSKPLEKKRLSLFGSDDIQI